VNVEEVMAAFQDSCDNQTACAVASIATPRWPDARTMEWVFSAWPRLLNFPKLSITALRLEDICEALREHADRFNSASAELAARSPINGEERRRLQPMSVSLTAKYPALLNALLQISLDLNLVSVAPSPVHGDGVFAQTDISKNSIVTTYPADLVQFLSDESTRQRLASAVPYKQNDDEQGCYFLVYPRGGGLLSPEALEAKRIAWGDSGLELPGGISIYADPQCHLPGACGHKINDSLNFAPSSNCVECFLCQGVLVGILSTRDILAGEELFMSYGEPYWAARPEKRATAISAA
jgi:hypothetical protein